ncbi:MAG: hypothetical protein ACKV2O_16640 [Acidimicrobiales bacterium]
MVLAALSLGVAAINKDRDQLVRTLGSERSVPTSAPADTQTDIIEIGPEQFRVLGAFPAANNANPSSAPLQAFTGSDTSQFSDFLRPLVGAGDAVVPVPDFKREVVVAFWWPSNACLPEVAGFRSLSGRALEPVMAVQGAPEACDDVLLWTTHVVAIEKATVEPWFVLHVPGSDIVGHADRSLRIDLDTRADAADKTGPADPNTVSYRLLKTTGVLFDPTNPPTFALDATSLIKLWQADWPGEEPPDIDFSTEIVVVFDQTFCGRLEGIALDSDGVLNAVKAEPADSIVCPSVGSETRMAIALERSSLPDTFRLFRGATGPLVEVTLTRPDAAVYPQCLPTEGNVQTINDIWQPVAGPPPTTSPIEAITRLDDREFPPQVRTATLVVLQRSSYAAQVIAVDGERTVLRADIGAYNGTWSVESAQWCQPISVATTGP